MPEGFEYPKITDKEYLDALDLLLKYLQNQKVIKGGEADEIFEVAQLRLKAEGLHEGMPYFKEVMAGRPETLKKYEQDSLKWQQELQKAYKQTFSDQVDFYKLRLQADQYEAENRFRQQELGEKRRQFDIEFGQKQADIMNRQFANEQEEKRLTAQSRAQLTFGSGLGEAGERSEQNAYKAQLAKQFEDTMKDILSTTAPRDWVVRAKAQQAIQNNPFVPQESSLGNQWSAAERDLAIEKQDLARLERMIKSGDVPTTPQLIDEYAAKEARVKMAEVIEKHKRKQFEESPEIDFATPKQTVFGNFEVGRPSETAQPKPIGIPKPLQQSFGITRFGQPALTPSGQQWARAPWAAREQFTGYAAALGQQPEDIASQMQMQLPKNLTLGRTWQPARSMV